MSEIDDLLTKVPDIQYSFLDGWDVITVPINIYAMDMLVGEENGSRVAEEWIGGVYVSTVLLGTFYYAGRFETMIFGGEHDRFRCNYDTIEEAISGHVEACLLVEGAPQ